MRKWMFALFAVLIVLISGCASSGGGAAASSDASSVADTGNLPEMAPYDDEMFEALPDMVAAE